MHDANCSRVEQLLYLAYVIQSQHVHSHMDRLNAHMPVAGGAGGAASGVWVAQPAAPPQPTLRPHPNITHTGHVLTTQVALVEQLLDDVWRGPAAVLLNPGWAAAGPAGRVPDEYASVVASVGVAYSFLPCAIQVGRARSLRVGLGGLPNYKSLPTTFAATSGAHSGSSVASLAAASRPFPVCPCLRPLHPTPDPTASRTKRCLLATALPSYRQSTPRFAGPTGFRSCHFADLRCPPALPCPQGLLGPKEGAVLRTASPDTPLARTPWRIVLKQGEQYMQVGPGHCIPWRSRVARVGHVSH